MNDGADGLATGLFFFTIAILPGLLEKFIDWIIL